jgi:hypothetical protein
LDPEVSEERAKAHDAAFVLCGDISCQYTEAKMANASASTPDRATRATGPKVKLDATLTFQDAAQESPRDRLRRLRRFAQSAAELAGALSWDRNVREKASGASDWAKAERTKVSLLGNDGTTAEELLGSLADQPPRVAAASLGTLTVYLSFDARGVCRGVYVVGKDAGSRTLDPGNQALREVLSQAVGRPASVRGTTSTNTTVSSWTEGSAKIVARWRQGAVVELRVVCAAIVGQVRLRTRAHLATVNSATLSAQ